MGLAQIHECMQEVDVLCEEHVLFKGTFALIGTFPIMRLLVWGVPEMISLFQIGDVLFEAELTCTVGLHSFGQFTVSQTAS